MNKKSFFLKPLDSGEILDWAFYFYFTPKNFLTFFGILSIAYMPLFGSLIIMQFLKFSDNLVVFLFLIVFMLILSILLPLSEVALIKSIAESFLEKPIDIISSYKKVFNMKFITAVMLMSSIIASVTLAGLVLPLLIFSGALVLLSTVPSSGYYSFFIGIVIFFSFVLALIWITIMMISFSFTYQIMLVEERLQKIKFGKTELDFSAIGEKLNNSLTNANYGKLILVIFKGFINIVQGIILSFYCVLRSFQLTYSYFWKVSWVMLCLSLFSYVLSHTIAFPFSLASLFLLLKDPHAFMGFFLNFIGQIGTILMMPILWVGKTVLYFDIRTRKEAFDLQLIMKEPLDEKISN